MRTVLVLLSLASLLAACAREPEGDAVADQPAQEVRAESQAQAPPPPQFSAAPRMGGALVGTGDFVVEVVANAEGSVDAAVTTAAGEAVTNADVAALEVTAQGEGQARQKIALGWDGPRGLFHGTAHGGARLASGPMEVSCSIRGKHQAGRRDMVVALPSPKLGGRMLAMGRYSAEVVPKVSGEVDVHVKDAAGVALAADGGLALKARAMGSGGAKAGVMHALALRWDAPRGCFTGKLEAGAELAPGPFELTARANGDLELIGRVEAIALVAPPTLGGSVVATGEYTVEVAPQLDGQVDAIVRNAAGVAVEGGVELDAHVQAGGELRPVKLTWDPALLRFRGKLEGDLQIEPGPIELSLVADGRLRTGAIMAAVVVPKLDVDAKAKLAAHADAKLGAKAKLEAAAAQKASAKAKAQLAGVKGAASGAAKLAVKVPQPSVNVKAGAQGDAKASTSAQARAAGGASAKGAAKPQAGVKLGGSLTSGVSLGTK